MTPTDSPPSPDQMSWWHQIELPGGYVTPGPDRSADKLTSLRLPDLAGKTVLDVGAFDGYFSFAAERLGASRLRLAREAVGHIVSRNRLVAHGWKDA